MIFSSLILDMIEFQRDLSNTEVIDLVLFDCLCQKFPFFCVVTLHEVFSTKILNQCFLSGFNKIFTFCYGIIWLRALQVIECFGETVVFFLSCDEIFFVSLIFWTEFIHTFLMSFLVEYGKEEVKVHIFEFRLLNT